MTCIVFAALRHQGQRALIDHHVTGDRLGQSRVIDTPQRLPVKRDGVTLVKVPAARRRGRGRSTSLTGLTQSQHRMLRTSQRRCSQQAPIATEVWSDYLTLTRARSRPRASPCQLLRWVLRPAGDHRGHHRDQPRPPDGRDTPREIRDKLRRTLTPRHCP